MWARLQQTVIPRLNFPNLRSFQLLDANGVCTREEWNSVMFPFFLRSNRLTHLVLQPCRGHWCIPRNTLHTYLSELRLLVNLSIWQSQTLPERTLEEMATGELVPMLETLECRVEPHNSRFWRMLDRRNVSTGDRQTRASGVVPIRHVVVVSRCSKKLEEMESLEHVMRWRFHGVCIDFKLLDPDLPKCWCRCIWT